MEITILKKPISSSLNECKISSHWHNLALVLKPVVRMKSLVKKKKLRCCLHCSLFPTDYEFERDKLVQLWMAEGLLKGIRMEDDGIHRFDLLVDEGYILPSRFDHLTRDFRYKVNLEKVNSLLSRIEDKGRYAILQDIITGISLQPRHVCVVSHQHLEILEGFNELRTLLFICKDPSSLVQVPSRVFSALGSLRALDLSRSSIKEVPDSVGYMTQLRYLDLSYTPIEELPKSIVGLHELQTLKLRGCERLFELPEGMSELTRLRHLDFDFVGHLAPMPRGIGRLCELQTLPSFTVDEEEEEEEEEGGCGIRELKNLINLRGSCRISGLENATGEDAKEACLKNKKGLTHLELRWVEVESDPIIASDTLDSLEPNPCVERLDIICYPGLVLPRWMGYRTFRKLHSIRLLNCKSTKLDVSLGELPELRNFQIFEMNNVRTIDNVDFGSYDDIHSTPLFPKLEKLSIDGMSQLETWGGVHSGGFPLLSELSIEHCPKLSAISFLAQLRSLKHLKLINCQVLESLSDDESERLSPSLETLFIADCPLLKKRCSRGGQDWDKIQHIPDIYGSI